MHPEVVMSQPKIVATIGLHTSGADPLRKLVDCGMDVARLNAAHSDLPWHARTIDLIRTVAPHVPIILDLPGCKVRTGPLERELHFDTGDRITFTTAQCNGNSGRIPVTGAELHEKLNVADVLSAEDGALRFTVLEVVGQEVICRADAPGVLGSCKGIGLPSSTHSGLLTDRDRQILALAIEKQVDFVGVSFVASRAHIRSVRELVPDGVPRVIAKIESQEGLDHLEEIAEEADALMVDRGDLSVQTSLESLVTSQKHILKVARTAARPVIIATELLHTMIANPFPTKAEVSDISNAVLDGASAVMLSGETAIGKYPFEAVGFMKQIAASASHYEQADLDRQMELGPRNIPSAVAEAVSLICRRLPVTKIVAITIGGYAARMVAASRPRQPLLAVSNDAAAARSFNLMPGTEGIHVDIPFSRTSTDHIARCLQILWRRKKLVEEDLVLVTSLGYPRSGNRMNMIQTHSISDLRQVLNWKA